MVQPDLLGPAVRKVYEEMQALRGSLAAWEFRESRVILGPLVLKATADPLAQRATRGPWVPPVPKVNAERRENADLWVNKDQPVNRALQAKSDLRGRRVIRAARDRRVSRAYPAQPDQLDQKAIRDPWG